MEKTTNNKWLNIMIEIGIILVGVAIAWATIRVKVDQNSADVIRHEVRITQTEQQVSDVRADIREIKVEQKYISQGITDIKEKLDK